MSTPALLKICSTTDKSLIRTHSRSKVDVRHASVRCPFVHNNRRNRTRPEEELLCGIVEDVERQVVVVTHQVSSKTEIYGKLTVERGNGNIAAMNVSVIHEQLISRTPDDDTERDIVERFSSPAGYAKRQLSTGRYRRL
jgi:hypothetical protein